MFADRLQHKDYDIPLVGGLMSKREAVRQLMEVKLFCLAKKYLSQEQQDEAARRLKTRKPRAERPEPKSEPDSAKPHKRKCELDKVQGEMKDIKKVFECLFLVELDFFTLSCIEVAQASASLQLDFNRSLGRLLRSCLVGAILMVLSDPLMIGEQQTLAFVDKLAGSSELTTKGKRRAILVKKLIEEEYGNSPDFLTRVADAAKSEVCQQEAAATGSLPKFEELCERLRSECSSEAEICARLVKALFVRFLIPASICVANDLPDEIEVSATVFDHTEIIGKAPRCGLIFLNEPTKVTPFFGLLPAKLRFKENFLQASLDHHAKKQSSAAPAGIELPAAEKEETLGDRSVQHVTPQQTQPPQSSMPITNRQFRQITDFTFNQDPDLETLQPHIRKNYPELFLEERRSAEFGRRLEEPPNVFSLVDQPTQIPTSPLVHVGIAAETSTSVEECAYLPNHTGEKAPAASIQSLIQKYTESINSMLEMQRELDNDGKISKMRRRFQKVELVKKMSAVLDLMDSNSQKIDLSISIVDSRKIAIQALQSRGLEFKTPEQQALETSITTSQPTFSHAKPAGEVIDRFRLPPPKEQNYKYAPLLLNDNQRYQQPSFAPPNPQPAPRIYQPQFQHAQPLQTFDREATSFVQYPASSLNASYVPSHQSYLPTGIARSNSSANFLQESSAYPHQTPYTDTRSYKDILPSANSYMQSKNTYIRR